VSAVKYELGFYIPEDDILHSHCRENLKSYICQHSQCAVIQIASNFQQQIGILIRMQHSEPHNMLLEITNVCSLLQ
jgi:hypothetical protein